MAKLSKMQAQAIINKLGREATNLRNQLIDEEKKNYTPSADAVKLAALLEKRDKLKAESEAAADEAKKFIDGLGITGCYAYTKSDEILIKLKDKEIEVKYHRVDLDAALDDLIIESVEEDFSVDNFIEHYLKQVRNG